MSELKCVSLTYTCGAPRGSIVCPLLFGNNINNLTLVNDVTGDCKLCVLSKSLSGVATKNILKKT